jgi:pyruvate/2-oxoacid:ferredoxin oxidoreductase beta subunit
MRLVLKELGEKTIVVLPACCWSIIAGPYPQSSLHVPLYHTAFETGAAVASGVRAALDMRGDTETTVMVWAGDGGTFDIGLQALSGAAERNENILYVCYDNEAYMNTGIQRSSATPWGAWTTTTPDRQPQARARRTSSPSWRRTASRTRRRRRLAPARPAGEGAPGEGARGTRFLHILSPCPPGWKFADDRTIELARMAVHNAGLPAAGGRGRRGLALHRGRARRAGGRRTCGRRAGSVTWTTTA